MTSIQSREIASANGSSGSYEDPGSEDWQSTYIIGDSVETPTTGTMDSQVTITQ